MLLIHKNFFTEFSLRVTWKLYQRYSSVCGLLISLERMCGSEIKVSGPFTLQTFFFCKGGWRGMSGDYDLF